MPVKTLKTRAEWDDAGENVVVLHMFGRAKDHPNASPYPIKVELFLRAAEIEYAADFSKPLSAKGKSPWMTFNKKDMADSQMCIDHLIETMPEKDLEAHLSDSDKAVARGFRALFEDNFYFVLVMKRWNFGDINYLFENVLPPFPAPKLLLPLIKMKLKKNILGQAKGQGIGLHSKDEIYEIGKKDLKALSDFLADKPFLMGSKFSTVDCTIFGFLVCVFWGSPKDDVHRVYAEKELPNLKEYALRIKEKYWPDWDECIYKNE